MIVPIVKFIGIMLLLFVVLIGLLQLIFVISLYTFNKVLSEAGIDPLSADEARKALRGEWD
jgi:uncharacterized protein YpmB